MKKLFLLAMVVALAGNACAQAQRDNRNAAFRDGPNAQYYTPQPRSVPSLPPGCALMTIAGAQYYFGGGQYYQPGNGGYLMVPPPAGATLTELPSDAQQVLIGDKLCYVVNGVTYRKTFTGYEVMPPAPIVVQQLVTAAPPVIVTSETPPPVPQPPSTNNTFTVNILNSKGGFTPVEIKRSGTNFLGPQGELYPEFPRVEQLKAMYVK